ELADLCIGKTLIIRGFYSNSKLKYDADAKPLSAKPGWWSINGSFLCESAETKNNEIQILGKRLMYVPWLAPPATFTNSGETVRITFPLSEDYKQTIRKIFIDPNEEDIVSMVPEYTKIMVAEVYGKKGPKFEKPMDVKDVGNGVL